MYDSLGMVLMVGGLTAPCTPPADLQGNVLKFVYHPSRLKVLEKCVLARGKVVKIRKEPDGDYHIMLALDPAYQNLLSGGQKNLVVEVVPHDQPRVHVRRVGSHVAVTGAWVYDRHHGWNEVHPCWSMEIS